MVDPKLREEIADIAEDAVLFDNPSFDGSIVGVSINGEVIYELDTMILEMSLEEGISRDEAEDFIGYNTVRALPYLPEPRPVIIAYKVKEDI